MSNINFINALVNGETEEIQSQFDAIMQEKIQNRLETFRQEVSQSIFKESVETEDSVEEEQPTE